MVPSQELWSSMKKLGVAKQYMRTVQDMHEDNVERRGMKVDKVVARPAQTGGRKANTSHVTPFHVRPLQAA